MRTLTEIDGFKLQRLLAALKKWTEESKPLEEIPTLLGAEFKAEGDALKFLQYSADIAKEKDVTAIKRIIVMSLAEGEAAPKDALQREEHYYRVEYYPRKPAPQKPQRRDDRKGGKRNDRKGGRKGDPREDRRGDRGEQGRGEHGRGLSPRTPSHSSTPGVITPVSGSRPAPSAGLTPPSSQRPARPPRPPRSPRPEHPARPARPPQAARPPRTPSETQTERPPVDLASLPLPPPIPTVEVKE